ncbi:MAG TPA: septum formation family protein [Pseudonocardiaceae bacterium]|nr:septum formation family protein [Pseudonocardiaceae bacterium]
MVAKAGWLHPTSPAGSTRLYMVGAFAGAVVLLALSVVAGWPVLPGRAATPPDPATVVANATAGTCLTWSKPDASNLSAVDCARPHLFEVTGAADISGQYPAGAPFPTAQAWQKAAQTSCTTSVTDYLGKLDPNGRFTVGALKPTTSQWASGDRSLRCGVQRSTPSGQLMPTTGSARGADQSNVYPTGTCLALVKKAAGGPVPCGSQHAYEIVGTVSLHGKFPDGYPAVADQQHALGTLCQPVASAYTGNANLSQYQLSVTWDTISQQSWAAGSYQVNCKIGSLLPDGSGLGPVINSVKGIGTGQQPPATSKPGG